MEFTCLAIRSYKFTQIYSFLHDILRWFCLLSVHIIYCEVGFIMRIWYDLFLFLRSWEILIFTFESWYHKRRWIHLVFHVWNTALKAYNILYTSSASCILYTRWAHETMFRYSLCAFKLTIFFESSHFYLFKNITFSWCPILNVSECTHSIYGESFKLSYGFEQVFTCLI